MTGAKDAPKCRWCGNRGTRTCQVKVGDRACGRPLCLPHAGQNCPEHMVTRPPPGPPGVRLRAA